MTMKHIYPYLLISLALLAVYFFLGIAISPQRIGDGMEYYALYFAWNTSHTPWMTPAAFEAYQQYYTASQMAGMLPGDWLSQQFPPLHLGNTMDFNHFWFYSLMAFVPSKVLSLVGIHLNAHQSFLLLHYLLLTMTASIAYRYYRWQGVAIVFFMTFLSPIWWFTDKVHTEFFTFCLVLSSVMLIHSKKYLPAALLLAIASTQNISFAPIACIPLFYRAVLQRDQSYTALDVIVCVITALVLLAHPEYYFARFGVVTPQLLAGGAAPGANLSSFYIWIFDPDLGLLPNWPLGLLALLLAAARWIWDKENRPKNIDKAWLVFLVLYLCINLYAQSSTTNLNSGATPGIARYALWYLPLIFPVLYWLINTLNWRNRGLFLLLPVVIVLAVVSIKQNNPRKHESYTTPSRISYFIQAYLPGLYNPPAEVFLERYSGFSETPYVTTLKGMIGPDCRKLLLVAGEKKNNVMVPEDCSLDPIKLGAYIDTLRTGLSGTAYVILTTKEVETMQKNP